MKKIMNVDWKEEIRKFNESGLSDRAWCATNKKPYSPSTLRRRIAEYTPVKEELIYVKDDGPKFVVKSNPTDMCIDTGDVRSQLIMHISNFNAKELELLLCYAEKILATKEMTLVQKRLEELNRKIRDGYLS